MKRQAALCLATIAAISDDHFRLPLHSLSLYSCPRGSADRKSYY